MATLPGGWIYVAVPSLDRLAKHRDRHYALNARAHLAAYTLDCLTTILGHAGFGNLHEVVLPRAEGHSSKRLRLLAQRGATVRGVATPLTAALRSLADYRNAIEVVTASWAVLRRRDTSVRIRRDTSGPARYRCKVKHGQPVDSSVDVARSRRSTRMCSSSLVGHLDDGHRHVMLTDVLRDDGELALEVSLGIARQQRKGHGLLPQSVQDPGLGGGRAGERPAEVRLASGESAFGKEGYIDQIAADQQTVPRRAAAIQIVVEGPQAHGCARGKQTLGSP